MAPRQSWSRTKTDAETSNSRRLRQHQLLCDPAEARKVVDEYLRGPYVAWKCLGEESREQYDSTDETVYYDNNAVPESASDFDDDDTVSNAVPESASDDDDDDTISNDGRSLSFGWQTDPSTANDTRVRGILRNELSKAPKASTTRARASRLRTMHRRGRGRGSIPRRGLGGCEASCGHGFRSR